MFIISKHLVLFIAMVGVPLSLHAAERHMLDRVASVAISSGKAESIGSAGVQDHDVTIVSRKPEGGGMRKYFWRLAENDEIIATVYLPADAEDVSVRVLMDSSVKQGETRLTWNSQTIGDPDDPLVLQSVGGGRNAIKVYLDDHKPENQLKLTGTKGETDIDAVEFHYRVPCPSWENDKVRMTLLEPAPDRVVDKDSTGEGIELRWAASGPIEQGWIKIEYREPGKEQWALVPGAEGISFGSKEWPSKTGSLIWHYDGDLPNLEFRILFNRGENPLVVRQQEERKAANAARELRKNLLELKRKSIVEIKTAIDPTLGAAMISTVIERRRSA